MMIQRQFADILVTDGGALVETRNCPRVQLPDGRLGAVFRGLAWPVLDGERIDLQATAFDPSTCTDPLTCCAVVEGEEEGYVLLSGSAAGCHAAAAALRGAGCIVRRSGRYLGEPLGTLDADWFIRASRPARADSLADLAEAALHATAIAPAPLPAALLQAQLLSAELLGARLREAELRVELARLRASLAADEAALRLEQETLRQALEQEQHLRLQAEAAATDATTKPRPPATLRMRDELGAVLAILVPHVVLLRDSLDMAVAFAARQAVWKLLQQLGDAMGAPPGWWKVQGVEGWWESHVSTGQDDSGRVYARRMADRRWEVLLSRKGQQSRDIAWLGRQ